MRKRDRIKVYVPYIAAGMYGLILKSITSKWGISVEEYALPIVLIWAVVVGWSVIKMDSIIDAFDKDDREEDE